MAKERVLWLMSIKNDRLKKGDVQNIEKNTCKGRNGKYCGLMAEKGIKVSKTLHFLLIIFI